jgi:hypothetical protein
VLPLALALALAADPLPGLEPPPPPADEAEPFVFESQEPRLDLTLWGGQAWTQRGSGLRSETYAAEATWRFDNVDLGLLGGCYELRNEVGGGTVETYLAPIYLARIGQRFETRNGLLANFTFGVGTLKAAEWRSWFQVALGARATFGPAFVAGELSFESDDFVRLALGLGVSLF